MIKRLILFALLVVLLAACRGRTVEVPPTATETNLVPTETTAPTDTPEPPTATATEAPTKTPTEAPPQDYGPTNFPDDVNPLTGQVVSDPSLLERRPVSIKIQMFPRGQRPPWGVSLADIVFDYYQNNGLTRLHAIFYGNNAEQVGPIRSARLFDGDVVNMFKTILAFGGADARIMERLYSAPYANRLVLEGASNCPPMCRIDPNQYNFLVADTEELSKYAESKGINNERQNLDGMKFQQEPPAGGEEATQIFNRFSISAYNRWDYDEDTGAYLRFQDTQEDNALGKDEDYDPLIDQLTNEQVSAANVIVILVPHEQIYRSASGNSEIIDIKLDTQTSGTGFAFRDGRVYEIKWSRANAEGVLTITLPDGEPYPFKPGVTWFEVMGETSTQTSEGDAWRFEFRLP